MLKALVACAGLAATAALAQTPPDSPASAKHGPSADPHEVVCVAQQEIGSRLNRRRVCRTRAEWAEHEQQYRQSVERAQLQSRTYCPPDRC